MQLNEIGEGLINLTINADDALFLSKACGAALGGSPPDDYFDALCTDEGTREIAFEAYAVALEAMHAAALMHERLGLKEQGEMTLSGLRAKGATWHKPGGPTPAPKTAPKAAEPKAGGA